MNKLFLFLIYGLCFLCFSCGSQRKLQRKAAETTELSSKLGFKVSAKDNLLLFNEAAGWLGTPYRYGGTTRKGVDCSGLTGQIYQKVYHTPLARTVADMAGKNCRKIRKSELETGDLVFFNTSKKKKGINHVGLFLKNGYFIHASTSKGVIVSNLHEDYYKKTWQKGGRVKK